MLIRNTLIALLALMFASPALSDGWGLDNPPMNPMMCDPQMLGPEIDFEKEVLPYIEYKQKLELFAKKLKAWMKSQPKPLAGQAHVIQVGKAKIEINPKFLAWYLKQAKAGKQKAAMAEVDKSIKLLLAKIKKKTKA